MAQRFFTPDGFKTACKSNEDISDAVIRVAAPIEVKAVSGERAVDFVISTDSVDRHGDRVSSDGWDLKNYRKNPVVCWAHDYDMLPVARAKNIRVDDGKLKATAVFQAAGKVPFNDIVYEMLADGFLNAASVGFQPRKWAWAEGDDRRLGMDFAEQELLEFSIVPVPANAECLVDARTKGVDVSPVVEWWSKYFSSVEDQSELKAQLDALLVEFDGLASTNKSLSNELKAQADKLQSLQAENAKFKAKKSPIPTPRLTSRALDLAKIVRAV